MLDKVPKKKCVSVNFSHALFSQFDFWTPKMEQICSSETSVRNHHSALYNISEEHRLYMTNWRCRPWCDSAWSGSERSSLVRSGL